MQIDPIIPIIVAIIGFLQIGLSLYAGKQQSKASTTKDIGETYSTLIKALEKRLEVLEKSYARIIQEKNILERKYQKLREDYEELKEKVKRNGNGKQKDENQEDLK